MGTLKAVARGGRAVLVEDRVDYPEGTELELDVREPIDELEDKELAELDAALEAGEREYQATGRELHAGGGPRARPGQTVMARIRVLPDALQQIERAASWWLEHRRRAPALFGDELSAAFDLLEGTVPLGASARVFSKSPTVAEPFCNHSSSVEHLRRTLRRVFNCARKSRLWTWNPAADVAPRSMDSRRLPPAA